jgi:hypothetical protein
MAKGLSLGITMPAGSGVLCPGITGSALDMAAG